ncbi:MAG TPA: LysR substrate-binding domain-containing protein [Acidimicrobiia bacterium]|nr:LysR substrate-binding domain-containing protein [Acidimicrobiia bacterium]
MELRHLRYFLAVAEELHFGRAAARVGIAQPPLSQQVRQLEAEMGVALLHRTKRRVELTPAGRVFLDDVRAVFAQTARAVDRARRTSRGELGRLEIGFVPSADLDVLPRVLRAWRRRFPRVDVGLHLLLPGAQIDALREGRIHVGFLRLPVEDATLAVEPILREPLVAVLPERHRLARRRRVAVAELQGEAMIVFPRDVAPAYYDVYMKALAADGGASRVLHPGSMQTNLGLVSAGLGVSLMPASIRNLRRAGVVYRPLAPPAPVVEMAIAYRREEQAPVVPGFLRIVRRVVGRRLSHGEE